MSNQNGVQIIDGVLSSFQALVSELTKGVRLCKKKVDCNNGAIGELQVENDFLNKKIEQASTLQNVLINDIDTNPEE